MAKGDPGDATPVLSIESVSTPANQDDIDLTSLDMDSSVTHRTVTANMHVVNLGNGPDGHPVPLGDGDLWITYFGLPNSTTGMLMAKYPGHIDPANPPAAGTLPVDFFYGEVRDWQGTGISDYYTLGYASGSMDTQNSIVSVTATFDQLGLNSGDVLGGPNAMTRMDYGTAGMVTPQTLPTDDPGALAVDTAMLNVGADYGVGKGCSYP